MGTHEKMKGLDDQSRALYPVVGPDVKKQFT